MSAASISRLFAGERREVRALAAEPGAGVEDALARRGAAQLGDDLRAGVLDREQPLAKAAASGTAIDAPGTSRASGAIADGSELGAGTLVGEARQQASRATRSAFARSASGAGAPTVVAEGERVGAASSASSQPRQPRGQAVAASTR